MNFKINTISLAVASKLLFVFLVAVFGGLIILGSNASALAPSKSESDFPTKATYKLVYDKANKIGEDLCKGKKDKATCIKGYRQEYMYLAFEVCNNEKSDSLKTTCYKKFIKDAPTLGKARQEAGYDANQRVDDKTPKPGGINVTALDGKSPKVDQCGKGEEAVKTKFNFGCIGNDYDGDQLNPILDVAYAIIRFLSIGVGIVLVGSIIWAGIQYSSSQGNPEQTQAAKNRIQNAVVGLVLYMFIYALIQYLVPGGLFT